MLRLFWTDTKSPLDGLRGRARFKHGQKTKKETQKVEKWIIEMKKSDLRKREKENGDRKERVDWGRFGDECPKRKPWERHFVLMLLIH